MQEDQQELNRQFEYIIKQMQTGQFSPFIVSIIISDKYCIHKKIYDGINSHHLK